MKNSFIKSLFVVLFVVALFFSCEKPEPITYSLRLGKNIEIVSPENLYINKIEEKTKITLRVNLPKNKAVNEFKVNGKVESLDDNNQYQFEISKNTEISVSFVDAYILTLNDNISVVSPSGLDLSRIPSGAQITVGVNIPDNKAIYEFRVNGEEETLNASNQYQFNISENTNISVSFVDTYTLTLADNISVISPDGLDLSQIISGTQITVGVSIPDNKAIYEFRVNGEVETLDASNQYQFNISENTEMSVSFINLYSLTLDDNISVVSPSGLNLSRIPENTEILLKIDIKDSCEVFEDLYDNTTPLNIDEVNYKLESGDIFAEKEFTMDKSYNLAVKYSENLKIPPVSQYEAITDGIQLNSGDYSGDILIPNFVTSIRDFAFNECDLLNSINIPDSVRNIGLWAFGVCRILEEIYIPLSVENIGAFAFAESSNLTIKCEASSKPDGWDMNWNPEGRPVQWGASR